MNSGSESDDLSIFKDGFLKKRNKSSSKKKIKRRKTEASKPTPTLNHQFHRNTIQSRPKLPPPSSTVTSGDYEKELNVSL